MHDVAWRGMWICVRSKDAQKQLARTSLSFYFGAKNGSPALGMANSLVVRRVSPGRIIVVLF